MTRTKIKNAENAFNRHADRYYRWCEGDSEGTHTIATRAASQAAQIALDFVLAGIDTARWAPNAVKWATSCEHSARKARSLSA